MVATAIVVVGILIVAFLLWCFYKGLCSFFYSDLSIDGLFDEEAMDETRNCEAEEASINGKKFKD